VRDDASVRADLSGRFTHVLVDEFQDTDPLQADPAAHRRRRSRNLAMAKHPARPGKLFVVGDPKQSIYRFRRADIALYEDVKQLLLAGGAELLHLSTSFRSVEAIQQAVNAGFKPTMQGGTQATYVALDPFRPGIAGQPAWSRCRRRRSTATGRGWRTSASSSPIPTPSRPSWTGW